MIIGNHYSFRYSYPGNDYFINSPFPNKAAPKTIISPSGRKSTLLYVEIKSCVAFAANLRPVEVLLFDIEDSRKKSYLRTVQNKWMNQNAKFYYHLLRGTTKRTTAYTTMKL